MSKLRTVKYAFLSFSMIVSSLCAEENETTIENLYRHAYTSISRIEEGKIFLKPNKLHFYQEKIYVEDVNGGGIAIPAVFSSARGLYVKSDEFNIFNLWQCKECEWWNSNISNPTRCDRCKKPRPR